MAAPHGNCLERTTDRIVGTKIQSLDGLRAIAVILVFCTHVTNHIPVVGQITWYIQQYVWQGWIGVDLFFVLSGFLITGILMDTRDAENYFSGFYARRVLRIFPLYYAVLTGLILASAFLTRMHASGAGTVAALVPLPSDRWTYFCFLTNWIGLWKAQWNAAFTSILAHFWSLGIEEQFYLVWPAVVWLSRPRWIPWIAGGLAVLSAVVRGAWAAHVGIQMLVPPASVAIQVATICRLDSLFLGALAAYFYRNPEALTKTRRWLPYLAALGIGLFLEVFSCLAFLPGEINLALYGSAPRVQHSMEDALRTFLLFGGYTLLAIGFAALVLLAASTEKQNTRLQRLLQTRTLGKVGKYSYGIYVFHVPIIGLANAFIAPRIFHVHNQSQAVLVRCVYIAALALLSYAVSALSYEWFEGPILRMKRHFEPRYAPAAEVTTPAVAAALPN